MFRDQEFSEDLAGTPSPRAVKRIENVIALRAVPVPRGRRPHGAPGAPDEYPKSATSTPPPSTKRRRGGAHDTRPCWDARGFAARHGLYFERHDGQAVTCDDFAQAMADANPAAR